MLPPPMNSHSPTEKAAPRIMKLKETQGASPGPVMNAGCAFPETSQIGAYPASS